MLDSRPLGLVTNPKENAEATACKIWLQEMLVADNRVLVPEIADYEVRRELLRAGKAGGVRALDALKTTLGYVPITTAAMLQAAAFWAMARQSRMQTAPDLALDGDVVLAAQAATLDPAEWDMIGANVVIATANAAHLARFTAASEWAAIAAQDLEN